MKTVVILGAGCSAGLAGLPTDKEFVKSNLNRRPTRQESLYFLFKAWEVLYGSGRAGYHGTVGDIRLEAFWNEIDENYNSPKIVLHSTEIDEWFDVLNNLSDKEQKARGDYYYYWAHVHKVEVARSPYEYLFMFAGWELRKLVAEKYGVTPDLKTKSNYENLTKKILEISEKEFPIYISFNYDTLLEQSLSDYHYFGLQDCSKREDVTNIIKPHGSVNWLHIVGESITAQRDPIQIQKTGYNAFDGKFRQHSIVGLVSNKIEFDRKKQENTEVLSLYANRLLPLITEVVREAEKLVIVGYSFPITDVHVWHALRVAKPTSLKEIIIIENGKTQQEIEISNNKLTQTFIPSTMSLKGDFQNQGILKWLNLT